MGRPKGKGILGGVTEDSWGVMHLQQIGNGACCAWATQRAARLKQKTVNVQCNTRYFYLVAGGGFRRLLTCLVIQFSSV